MSCYEGLRNTFAGRAVGRALLPFAPLPLLSISFHTGISFLPSVSSWLPFYFFLAPSSLAISPPCLPSSLLPHFSWPSSLRHVCSCFKSSRSFSMFPCSHLLPENIPRVSALLLHFSPSPSLSSLLPLFPTLPNFWHLQSSY